ncbi:MAG: hypothetical protein QM774_12450 [Gordonia sp. (in: high G+C Gram-positive bacteria)]|uniref:hypothetical protein n=1 Tax=Gordonia sp. (in: high G+C Gram-positive bacteria) TaxID=84139 RepID=UPI0039E2A9F4
MNQSQIAEKYGVTRAYISWILKQHAKVSPRRESLRLYWPWPEAKTAHRQSKLGRALKDHIVWMDLQDPDELSAEAGMLLPWLYGELDLGQVVEFDPTIPTRGKSPAGWIFRDRQVTDRDLIIRVNRYTQLTDEMEKVWRMPETRPY